jgi:DNA-binding NarL/FixJ family response regulator
MNEDERVRVVVVDDHPAFRAGLASLLDSTDEVEVVGAAADGAECLEVVERLQPDVVLMDLHMTGMGGIEATRALSASYPGTVVIALTMIEEDESIFAAIRAGARGYLLKGADQDDLLRAIRSAAAGDVVFGRAIAERVVGYLAGGRPSRPERSFPELTDRELEVLDRIARGERNATIASHLGVAEKTVRNHISNIFAKLRIVDRAEAIVRARDAGLGQTDHTPMR